MRKTFFPTKEQLEAMPLSQLRLIDIQDAEEEALVQAVIDMKTADFPPITPIFKGDVPDIKTPEEEAKWQAEIDARTKKAKVVEVKEEVKEEVSQETKEETPLIEKEQIIKKKKK